MIQLTATGTLVVGKKGTDYETLRGYVVNEAINEPEGTENTPLEDYIIIDFEETERMEETHPHLNGTHVEEVYMEKSELIYFPEELNGVGVDTEGQEYLYKEVVYAYPEE